MRLIGPFHAAHRRNIDEGRSAVLVCSRPLFWLGSGFALIALLTGYWASGLMAQEPEQRESAAGPESQEHPASRVAGALQRALSEGDSVAVERLMAPDVRVFESGNVESSFQEYASHHMRSDMEFMGAMHSEVLDRRVIDAVGMAAVLTRYRITGQWRGKAIALVSTETLVLKPSEGEWRIVHIHWSSD